MTQLYLRTIKVEIQSDDQTFNVPEGLKIELNITKNSTNVSATGTVTILNLTTSTRSILREKGKIIKIFAGYKNDINLIHQGEIWYTTTVAQGVDKPFVITLGANSLTQNTANFNRSYEGSNDLKMIVKDVLDTFQTPYAVDILDSVPEATLDNYSFNGRSFKATDDLLKPYNLQVFDRNNQLFLSEIGEALAGQEDDIYVLNASSGLVETPTVTDVGVNAISLMNGRLQAGQIVKIESDVLSEIDKRSPAGRQLLNNKSGFYKITQSVFRGDNWDGTFQTVIQCVPFSPSSTNA